MSKQTLITSRDPKGLHAVGLFEVAYNKSKLDDGRAQRLNERGGEFQDGIAKLIRELSASNQFADEEVRSSYTYPKEYKGPKPIEAQVKALAEIFGLNPADALEFAKNLPALPDDAEGWFAIPRWEKIAPTYGEAVQKALDMVKQTRNGAFRNHREGQLGPQYLRQSQKSATAYKRISDEQKDHDILVIPSQFGIRHAGRSVRRACGVMNASEFGHGSFAIGIMLLAHPERLLNNNDLWIDCAGDEFAPDADGAFSESPFFYFHDDEVRFPTSRVGIAHDRYGSASGFLTQ